MKTCWARYLLWLTIALTTTAPVLSGCGQYGDLYLPDEEQSEDQDES